MAGHAFKLVDGPPRPTTDGSAYKPPRDEYATYADTVGGMLHRGATADDVESYLQRVEVQEMGLGPAANREAVAAEIVAWYAQATANEDASS